MTGLEDLIWEDLAANHDADQLQAPLATKAPSRFLNRRVVAAGCAAPLCAGAVFAATSFANRGDSTLRHRPVPSATEVNKKLVADFAIFRETTHKAGRADRMGVSAPALPTQMLENSIGLYGLDTKDVQYVQSGPAGVWAVPGSNGACLVMSYPPPDGATTYSAHCGTLREITSLGLDVAMSWQPPAGSSAVPGVAVAALVPNGNRTVSVNGPAGSVTSELVTDNVAVHSFPYGTVKLTYQSATGSPTSIVQQF